MPSGSGMRRPIGAWPWLALASASVPWFSTATLLHVEWRHCPVAEVGIVVLHGEGSDGRFDRWLVSGRGGGGNGEEGEPAVNE
jgi:hypothetical protein